MIEVSDLSFGYPGRPLLRDCSLSLPAGAHAALIGPSGCGKTTLMRLLLGLLQPQKGHAELHGRAACVFQEPRLLPNRTALQNVNAVLSDRASTLDEARRWLELVRLGEAADRLPAALSGGMQQRVAIARALAWGGNVFLLDEPLKGLDGELRAEIAGLLRSYSSGKTLLLITHDPDEADLLTDSLLVWQDGTFLPA